MSNKVVSAFPLPPSDWRERKEGNEPIVPGEGVTIFNYPFNESKVADSLTDTELKERLVQKFEECIEEYKRLLINLDGNIASGDTQLMNEKWRECFELSSLLCEMMAVDDALKSIEF